MVLEGLQGEATEEGRLKVDGPTFRSIVKTCNRSKVEEIIDTSIKSHD